MQSVDRRGSTSTRRGMTVLGKIPSVPKPVNLPSQRLENRGLDPNVEIVPKGSHTWGNSTGKSPPSASSAWPISSSSQSAPTSSAASPSASSPWGPGNAASAANDSNSRVWPSIEESAAVGITASDAVVSPKSGQKLSESSAEELRSHIDEAAADGDALKSIGAREIADDVPNADTHSGGERPGAEAGQIKTNPPPHHIDPHDHQRQHRQGKEGPMHAMENPEMSSRQQQEDRWRQGAFGPPEMFRRDNNWRNDNWRPQFPPHPGGPMFRGGPWARPGFPNQGLPPPQFGGRGGGFMQMGPRHPHAGFESYRGRAPPPPMYMEDMGMQHGRGRAGGFPGHMGPPGPPLSAAEKGGRFLSEGARGSAEVGHSEPAQESSREAAEETDKDRKASEPTGSDATRAGSSSHSEWKIESVGNWYDETEDREESMPEDKAVERVEEEWKDKEGAAAVSASRPAVGGQQHQQHLPPIPYQGPMAPPIPSVPMHMHLQPMQMGLPVRRQGRDGPGPHQEQQQQQQLFHPRPFQNRRNINGNGNVWPGPVHPSGPVPLGFHPQRFPPPGMVGPAGQQGMEIRRQRPHFHPYAPPTPPSRNLEGRWRRKEGDSDSLDRPQGGPVAQIHGPAPAGDSRAASSAAAVAPAGGKEHLRILKRPVLDSAPLSSVAIPAPGDLQAELVEPGTNSSEAQANLPPPPPPPEESRNAVHEVQVEVAFPTSAVSRVQPAAEALAGSEADLGAPRGVEEEEKIGAESLPVKLPAEQKAEVPNYHTRQGATALVLDADSRQQSAGRGSGRGRQTGRAQYSSRQQAYNAADPPLLPNPNLVSSGRKSEREEGSAAPAPALDSSSNSRPAQESQQTAAIPVPAPAATATATAAEESSRLPLHHYSHPNSSTGPLPFQRQAVDLRPRTVAAPAVAQEAENKQASPGLGLVVPAGSKTATGGSSAGSVTASAFARGSTMFGEIECDVAQMSKPMFRNGAVPQEQGGSRRLQDSVAAQEGIAAAVQRPGAREPPAGRPNAGLHYNHQHHHHQQQHQQHQQPQQQHGHGPQHGQQNFHGSRSSGGRMAWVPVGQGRGRAAPMPVPALPELPPVPAVTLDAAPEPSPHELPVHVPGADTATAAAGTDASAVARQSEGGRAQQLGSRPSRQPAGSGAGIGPSRGSADKGAGDAGRAGGSQRSLRPERKIYMAKPFLQQQQQQQQQRELEHRGAGKEAGQSAAAELAGESVVDSNSTGVGPVQVSSHQHSRTSAGQRGPGPARHHSQNQHLQQHLSGQHLQQQQHFNGNLPSSAGGSSSGGRGEGRERSRGAGGGTGKRGGRGRGAVPAGRGAGAGGEAVKDTERSAKPAAA